MDVYSWQIFCYTFPSRNNHICHLVSDVRFGKLVCAILSSRNKSYWSLMHVCGNVFLSIQKDKSPASVRLSKKRIISTNF